MKPETPTSKVKTALSKLGTTTMSRDIPLLVDLYERGELELDGLVSGRYPLDRINEAVDDSRRGEAIRNVIVFGR